MASSAVRMSTSEEDLWKGEETRRAPVHIQKFPIRRLRPTILKFQKVLEIDLDRLQKHRNNMNRLTVLEDWVGLHKEQVNATRTVQQVKATLRDLERTRAQVHDEDLDQFDKSLQDVKLQALTAVQNFLRFTQAEQLQPDILFASGDINPGESASLPCTLSSPTSPVRDLPLMQTQLEFHHVPENSQAAASGEELLKDMQELNELVHHFADLVKEQGEVVDRIEDNVEQASTNVREGTVSLAKASRYKMAAFPLVGALVGAAVAGPFGLVAGAKIGGLAGAVGGGIAGFSGGTFLKSRHNKVVSVEMQNLEDRSQEPLVQRSTSTPELFIAPTTQTSPHDSEQENQPDAQEASSQSMFSNLFPWRLRQTQSQSDEQ